MVFVRTRGKNNRRGAATIELALVLPLLILLTFGAIKYGWLFLKAQQITNATRYGARLAILPDATTTGVKTAIIDMLALANISIVPGNITITPVDISSLSVGDAVKVQVIVPAANVDIMNVSLFPPIANVGASVTMAKEGF
jgi:Flp pilus assembly protein TadG